MEYTLFEKRGQFDQTWGKEKKDWFRPYPMTFVSSETSFHLGFELGSPIPISYEYNRYAESASDTFVYVCARTCVCGYVKKIENDPNWNAIYGFLSFFLFKGI